MKLFRNYALVLALGCSLTTSALAQAIPGTGAVKAAVTDTVNEIKQDETSNIVFKFGAIAVVAAIVHTAGQRFQLSASTQSFGQVANLLLQLGYLTDKQVLTDLGIKTILCGVASKIAASEGVTKGLMPNLPFGMGPLLVSAGAMGVAASTVATYETLQYGYTKLAKLIPLLPKVGASKKEL